MHETRDCKQKAVFMDRDGTINVEKNYLHKIDDWEWIQGAIEAIRRINQMGFKAVVVSNQAGVARGYYDMVAVEALHNAVDEQLTAAQAHIDGYYFCPHHPDFGSMQSCSCRKPEPGMLLAASRDLNIDLNQSYLIGDKRSDIEAALACGVTPVLVRTGYGAEEIAHCPPHVTVCDDILDAVRFIENAEGNPTASRKT